jgi:hypothetical protein
MNKKVLSLTLFCASCVFTTFAQDRGELWIGAGVSKKIVPNTILSFQSNLRASFTMGPQTVFQELGLKSEHLDWLQPAIDYRLVTNFDNLGNATTTNRLNFNATFKYKLGALRPSLRFRYQTFIGNFNATGTDLDPSFRLKPSLKYKINDSRIQPSIGAEFFYDLGYGPTGRRFNRQRYGLGAEVDLPGSNELAVTMYYGRKFNTGNPYNEFLFSIEYNFELKKKKTST